MKTVTKVQTLVVVFKQYCFMEEKLVCLGSFKESNIFGLEKRFGQVNYIKHNKKTIRAKVGNHPVNDFIFWFEFLCVNI
jgi:hypothetical protein